MRCIGFPFRVFKPHIFKRDAWRELSIPLSLPEEPFIPVEETKDPLEGGKAILKDGDL